MALRESENVVICFDTSRSMYRTDIKPNRLFCCTKAIKKLIEERYQGDRASKFAIVNFSDSSKKVSGFSEYSEELFTSLDSLRFGGQSALGDGLALSIKIILEDLRRIMANVPRILIISDGNYTETSIDPLKMARLAQGLNIKIDSFRLGEQFKLGMLKKISDLTGGKYFYINDYNTLLKSAKDFAEGNIKQSSADSTQMIDNPQLLRKIAAELLNVQDLSKDQESKIKHLRGEADYKKCTICFQEKDPISKGSFFLTGRYCPNCQAPFHVGCLSEWSSSQKSDKLRDSGTCRCPHCFYLLKIPTEVTQARRLRTLSGTSSQKAIGPKKSDIIPAKLINTSVLGDQALYNSCPVCNFIFEDNQEIVQCGNYECEALYHKECFQQLEKGHCKTCSVKLTLERQY